MQKPVKVIVFFTPSCRSYDGYPGCCIVLFKSLHECRHGGHVPYCPGHSHTLLYTSAHRILRVKSIIRSEVFKYYISTQNTQGENYYKKWGCSSIKSAHRILKARSITRSEKCLSITPAHRILRTRSITRSGDCSSITYAHRILRVKSITRSGDCSSITSAHKILG